MRNVRQECLVDGCDRKAHGQGYCKSHWGRINCGRDVGGPFVKPIRPNCAVEDCQQLSYVHGMCSLHDYRRKKGYDLNTPKQIKRPRAPANATCEIAGCNSKRKAQGLCNLHYQRLKQDIDMTKPPRWMPGEYGKGRWLEKNGYITCIVPKDTYGARKNTSGTSRCMAEHRYVMQCHIGRPLLRTETVHHKDGNKGNNSINNLELKASNHGPGISLVDGAIACLDFLERYAGLDLYERAVLAGIRAKVDRGTLGEIEPIKNTKRRNVRLMAAELEMAA